MRCDSLHCLEYLQIRCNSVIGFCLARVGSPAILMASASANTLCPLIFLVAHCKLFQVWGVGANYNSSPLAAHTSPDRGWQNWKLFRNSTSGTLSITCPHVSLSASPRCAFFFLAPQHTRTAFTAAGISEFIYFPIPASADGFRILRLRPGSPDDSVECDLIIARLDSSNLLSYDALSYYWGDPDDRKTITVHGHE